MTCGYRLWSLSTYAHLDYITCLGMLGVRCSILLTEWLKIAAFDLLFPTLVLTMGV